MRTHVMAMLGLRVGVRVPVVRHIRLRLRLRLLVDGYHAAERINNIAAVAKK